MQNSSVGVNTGGEVDAIVIFLLIVLVLLSLVFLFLHIRSKRIHADQSLPDSEPPMKTIPKPDWPSERPGATKPVQQRSQNQVVYLKHADAIITPDHDEELDVPTQYEYTRRRYIMSERERGFYRRLHHVFGKFYLIFPQIHLNDLLAHDHVYQNWQGALSTIQRKSVDYVICTTDFKILLAIELDDITHRDPERQKRDRMVNYIFKKAKLPLLRVTNVETMTDQQIHYKVMSAIFEPDVPGSQKIQG